MRKVIVTVCVVVAAAAAAQAQGTARLMNWEAKEYQRSREARVAEGRQGDAFTKELERQAVRKYKQTVAARRSSQSSVRKNTGNNGRTVRPAGNTSSSCPSYYYGREGKMMALGELTRNAAAARREASGKGASRAKPAGQSSSKPKTKTQESEEETSWWRAIFLGGRYPGESKEEYRARLEVQGYPANQPFK